MKSTKLPIKVPIRYLPSKLSKKDKSKQIAMLFKSKRLYKQNKYYKLDTLSPNKDLASKTGCSISALKQIIKKGEGAYFSSGSRPNQTAQSWGLARLASSLTSGKSAAVDYDIIKNGCKHNKKAFKLANKARLKYKYGHSRTKKISI